MSGMNCITDLCTSVECLRIIKKADIGEGKADIDSLKEYGNLLLPFSAKIIAHVRKMYETFGREIVFGRTDVQAVTGLKHTRASELLSVLVEARIIGPVAGHGKGRYRFSRDIFPSD